MSKIHVRAFNAKMLIVIKYLFLIKSVKCCVDKISICAFHEHEQETSMQLANIFGGIYSMILSWNFEYALALQSTKTISFHNVRHPMNLSMLFAFPKSIFIS